MHLEVRLLRECFELVSPGGQPVFVAEEEQPGAPTGPGAGPSYLSSLTALVGIHAHFSVKETESQRSDVHCQGQGPAWDSNSGIPAQICNELWLSS